MRRCLRRIFRKVRRNADANQIGAPYIWNGDRRLDGSRSEAVLEAHVTGIDGRAQLAQLQSLLACIKTDLRAAAGDILEAPYIFRTAVGLHNGSYGCLAGTRQRLAWFSKQVHINADGATGNWNAPDIPIAMVPDQQTVTQSVVGQEVNVIEGRIDL